MSNAKLIFQKILVDRFFAEGETSDWALALDDEDAAALDLTSGMYVAGLRTLQQRGLLEQPPGHGFRLTQLGVAACRDETKLDAALGIGPSPPGGTAFHIGAIHGPTQVGNGNTQNITTYSTVLTSLVEQIEQAPYIPPEEKRSMVQHLQSVLDSKTAQTILGAGIAAYVKSSLGG